MLRAGPENYLNAIDSDGPAVQRYNEVLPQLVENLDRTTSAFCVTLLNGARREGKLFLKPIKNLLP